ncbi:hypothetical protein BDW67DRAFT_181925 [Aspergillus spinulosporus]
MATINTGVDFSQSRQAEVHLIRSGFTGIAIATVGLKVTARHKVQRLGWDDFFIFFSLDQAVFYDFSYWVSANTTMTDIILAIVPITVF